MFFKRKISNLVRVLLITFLVCPLIAQKSVNKFKDVNIPYTMKHENTVLEKGKYDFEILKYSSQTVFYLSIKKRRGQNLCLIIGERLKYTNLEIETNQIPQKSKLSIKKNPEKKLLYITYESGSSTVIFPLLKIRWELEYE